MSEIGRPTWGAFPLFFRSPRRPRSRIPAGKDWSVADNFLHKQQEHGIPFEKDQLGVRARQMTPVAPSSVTPAKAGAQEPQAQCRRLWIPAFAGMTRRYTG